MEAKTGNLYDFLANSISVLIKAKVTLLYFISSIKLCYVFYVLLLLIFTNYQSENFVLFRKYS